MNLEAKKKQLANYEQNVLENENVFNYTNTDKQNKHTLLNR